MDFTQSPTPANETPLADAIAKTKIQQSLQPGLDNQAHADFVSKALANFGEQFGVGAGKIVSQQLPEGQLDMAGKKAAVEKEQAEVTSKEAGIRNANEFDKTGKFTPAPGTKVNVSDMTRDYAQTAKMDAANKRAYNQAYGRVLEEARNGGTQSYETLLQKLPGFQEWTPEAQQREISSMNQMAAHAIAFHGSKADDQNSKILEDVIHKALNAREARLNSTLPPGSPEFTKFQQDRQNEEIAYSNSAISMAKQMEKTQPGKLQMVYAALNRAKSAEALGANPPPTTPTTKVPMAPQPTGYQYKVGDVVRFPKRDGTGFVDRTYTGVGNVPWK